MAKGFKTGGGSRKGCPNKMTRDLKEMIVTAVVLEDGVEYLRKCARENPAAFLALVGRAMPLQVHGVDDEPVLIVTGIPRPEDGITRVPQLGQSSAEPIGDAIEQQANTLTQGGRLVRLRCLLSYCSS
jgi:hypothetical protein